MSRALAIMEKTKGGESNLARFLIILSRIQQDQSKFEEAESSVKRALTIDVKLKGQSKVFASDLGEPRLRIDRSGYFRTAVRLPKDVTAASAESITRNFAVGMPACRQRCLVRTLSKASRLASGPQPV